MSGDHKGLRLRTAMWVVHNVSFPRVPSHRGALLSKGGHSWGYIFPEEVAFSNLHKSAVYAVPCDHMLDTSLEFLVPDT